MTWIGLSLLLSVLTSACISKDEKRPDSSLEMLNGTRFVQSYDARPFVYF